MPVRSTVLAAILLGSLTTGCNSFNDVNGCPDNAKCPASPGTPVVGTLVGQSGGHQVAIAGHVSVHVTSAAGTVVRTLPVAADGRFTTYLAANTYYLTGEPTPGTALSCAPQTVVIKTDDGPAVRVTLLCT